jgi:hypothetical protein
MPVPGMAEQLRTIERRCDRMEAALATILDTISEQIEIQAEAARSIELLSDQVLLLRAHLGLGHDPTQQPIRPELHVIQGKPREEPDG